MPPRRKPTPSSKKRLCDDIWRRVIVSRGSCERCGDSGVRLEAAHIIRRRYSWTRTWEPNGWALCHQCHTTVDTYASQHADLVEKTIGQEGLMSLEFRSMRRDKFDWFAEHERLKLLRKEAA